ncbi:hypothetical protein [Streptomyces sp. NPDC001978]|uniref:hypothetical protein n=1 Tax=Streptomyces sp. NPDC001978 TaxID=3364627 RepID=UPI0036986D2E
MTAEETASYLARNIKLVGHTDALFSGNAISLIHTTSRGLPGAVNNLAAQALLAAFIEDKAIVDASSACAAVAEVTIK